VSLALCVPVVVTACGSSPSSKDSGQTGAGPSGTTSVEIAQGAGAGSTPGSIQVAVQPDIRNELPPSVVSRGKFVIGVGALGQGAPPLAFVGSDGKTVTGSDPDLARLVAAVFGLAPDVENSTFDNLFVGIDSGKVDAGFSDTTITEQRKKKYEFASYGQDNLGFGAKASNTWNFNGNYENLAGLTVAVDAGTSQEKLLLSWQSKLQAEGKSLSLKYFPDVSSAWSAVVSGQVDAYFIADPTVLYQAKSTAGTPRAIRDAGAVSASGSSLQGLIGATTKQGSGLVKPIADAINHLIKNGQYQQLLNAYGLISDAVPASVVNPPGLPASGS